MKKSIDKFLDAPLTYRRCFKVTGIMYLVCIPIYVAYLVHLGLIDLSECWEGVKGLFRKLKSRFVK